MALSIHFRRWAVFLSAAFLGLVLLFPVPGGCADDDRFERPLKIAEAVIRALEDNHEIKAMKSASAAKLQDIGIARSYLLPRISIEERFLRTNQPGYAFMSRLNQQRIEQVDFYPDTLNHPDAINDFQSSVTIEQPLFVKKALVGLDMSRRESKAQDEELKRKHEEIAFQVVVACLSIASAKEYVRAAGLGVAEAREHLRVADLRHKNELGQYADSMRAATALTEARQRLNAAQKNVSLARRGLGLLLARTDSPDIEEAFWDLPLKDLSFYTQNAQARSDLQALALRRENAGQNVKAAEAGYYPSVGVGGTYQLNDHNQPFGSEGKSWQVMAFLRWDLFDGTRREYERARARHLEAQSQEYLSAMKKGVLYRIYEAYLNVEEARNNMDLALEALKTAEEGVRLLRLRYENGLSPLGDLLDAQTSFERARAGWVERSNAYKTALMALSFESGTILRDLGIDRPVP